MDSKSVRLSGGARRRKSVKKTSKKMSKSSRTKTGSKTKSKMSGGAKRRSKTKSKTRGSKSSGRKTGGHKRSNRMKGGNPINARTTVLKGATKDDALNRNCNELNEIDDHKIRLECLDNNKADIMISKLSNLQCKEKKSVLDAKLASCRSYKANAGTYATVNKSMA